jgi:hypothetical protein
MGYRFSKSRVADRRVKLNCPSGTFALGTETISDFAVNPLTTVLGDLGKLQQQLTFILW